MRRGLAWAGLIWCCFLVLWTSGGLGWVPFLVIGGLCAVYLIYAGRRAKRLRQTLPSAIERLAYRSDDTAVAFAWRWRRGRAGHVRILRSDSRGARSPDDTSNGQTCVFDGSDDKLIDRDIVARRTYHYSLFVCDDKGRWSDPICQLVLTYPLAERTAIEATYKGPPPGTLEAESLQRARPWSLGDPLADLGDALGGLATDLIFSAASVFTADKAADGWEEIT